VPEARLEDSGSDLAPASEGWFVVNVRDAEWLASETSGKQARGSMCEFESQTYEFPELGLRLHVLEPGEPSGLSTTPSRTKRLFSCCPVQQAYVGFGWFQRERPSYWDRLPWSWPGPGGYGESPPSR
jgi:hypothetical protein